MAVIEIDAWVNMRADFDEPEAQKLKLWVDVERGLASSQAVQVGGERKIAFVQALVC